MNKEYKPLWQTVIEQHGGYEKCNEILKKPNIDFIMNAQGLREHMLEYRRQHNIFEVGDKVIIVQKVWGEDPWDDLCYVFNAKTHHIVGVGIDISVGFGSSQAYRHATDAEIKAGKRL